MFEFVLLCGVVLVLATLVVKQRAQIRDLREKVGQLERRPETITTHAVNVTGNLPTIGDWEAWRPYIRDIHKASRTVLARDLYR